MYHICIYHDYGSISDHIKKIKQMSINLHVLIIFFSLQHVSDFCKTTILQFYPVKFELGESERGRKEIPGTRRPWVTPKDQELREPKMAKLYRKEKLGEDADWSLGWRV